MGAGGRGAPGEIIPLGGPVTVEGLGRTAAGLPGLACRGAAGAAGLDGLAELLGPIALLGLPGAGAGTTRGCAGTLAPGSGCRGPERICPGLGAGGSGLAGIGALRSVGV
ncbi:MAG: hypothetical protein M3021_07140 [Actinomycetota bacterium]|nr:hypothetical protein [Actinomycetota bacterium]